MGFIAASGSNNSGGASASAGDFGGQTIYAGPGRETVDGEPGDTLIGGRGHDNFVFSPGFGKETIENFHPRYDVISLPASSFSNLSNVWADTYPVGSEYHHLGR